MVTPLAHVVFKIYLANANSRLGSRSNFACQDVTGVTMLLAGKQFDLADLILKNMNDIFHPHNTHGLPYGLLLTQIF